MGFIPAGWPLGDMVAAEVSSLSDNEEEEDGRSSLAKGCLVIMGFFSCLTTEPLFLTFKEFSLCK